MGYSPKGLRYLPHNKFFPSLLYLEGKRSYVGIERFGAKSPGGQRAESKENQVKKKNHKLQSIVSARRYSPGKMVTGLLIGGVVGAAVGWLTAPNSGRETLRKLRGEALDVVDVRERTKTADGNVESRVRELVEEAESDVGREREIARRKRVATSQSWK